VIFNTITAHYATSIAIAEHLAARSDNDAATDFR
jgi:hypothetical protein